MKDYYIVAVCSKCGLQKNISPDFFNHALDPIKTLTQIMSSHDCKR